MSTENEPHEIPVRTEYPENPNAEEIYPAGKPFVYKNIEDISPAEIKNPEKLSFSEKKSRLGLGVKNILSAALALAVGAAFLAAGVFIARYNFLSKKEDVRLECFSTDNIEKIVIIDPGALVSIRNNAVGEQITLNFSEYYKYKTYDLSVENKVLYLTSLNDYSGCRSSLTVPEDFLGEISVTAEGGSIYCQGGKNLTLSTGFEGEGIKLSSFDAGNVRLTAENQNVTVDTCTFESFSSVSNRVFFYTDVNDNIYKSFSVENIDGKNEISKTSQLIKTYKKTARESGVIYIDIPSPIGTENMITNDDISPFGGKSSDLCISSVNGNVSFKFGNIED